MYNCPHFSFIQSNKICVCVFICMKWRRWQGKARLEEISLFILDFQFSHKKRSLCALLVFFFCPDRHSCTYLSLALNWYNCAGYDVFIDLKKRKSTAFYSKNSHFFKLTNDQQLNSIPGKTSCIRTSVQFLLIRSIPFISLVFVIFVVFQTVSILYDVISQHNGHNEKWLSSSAQTISDDSMFYASIYIVHLLNVNIGFHQIVVRMRWFALRHK